MRFLRNMVKNGEIRSPEKCGKRFMKFCDDDKDDFVTVDELLVCTEINRRARKKDRKSSKYSLMNLGIATSG